MVDNVSFRDIWAPRALAALRIVTGYLFVQHGTAKLFGVPHVAMFDHLTLFSLIGLAGVLVSPALATAYVLTDSLASPKARNRAGNWVNSGYNAGSSAGAALSGQLVGRIPLSACLPVLAAPALLAVVPLLRVRLTPTAEQPAAPGGPAGGTTPPAAEVAGADQ